MKLIPAMCVPLLLVGCTVERTIVQPAETNRPSAPSTYATAVKEDLFVNGIDQVYGKSSYISDAELLETGYLICDGLDAGQSVEDLLEVINSVATSADSLNFLTIIAASAITFLCPSHKDLLEIEAGGV